MENTMENPIKHIYNACNPYKPAASECYFDCSKARGSHVLVQEFQRRLALIEDSHFIRFLFTGHIGCGKSSDLGQLCHTLANPTTPSEKIYFPILLNANDYIDDYDTDITDIMLAIVTELAATLRDKLKIELQDNYFTQKLNEIKSFFLSQVDFQKIQLTLPGAKADIQRLKKDPDVRKKVRNSLNPKISTILQEINILFSQARMEIQKVKPEIHDFVLILDNLEKIIGFAEREEGLASQRELFIERAPQLTGLEAHVIYTVPLRLVRADGPQLGQRYGDNPFVLPMVKVIRRGTQEPFHTGHHCMRELLQKHLGNELLLTHAFETEAIDFLLTYSGGHIRNLMVFIQNACTYADNIPISLKAAQLAIQQTVRTYSTSIPTTHWKKLAVLDNSEDQMIPSEDEDYMAMLDNLSVLEYINGDNEDVFTVAEPWYAVNPIVRQLRKFKENKKVLEQQA